MMCPNCKFQSSHIKIIGSVVGCHHCMQFSESGGSRTDKILTRNADRITEQQVQFEGDMVTPYIVDKSTNKAVVNEEFINLYPEQAAQTFSQEELKSVGQSDLKPPVEIDDKQGIEFKGDESEAIAGIVQL